MALVNSASSPFFAAKPSPPPQTRLAEHADNNEFLVADPFEDILSRLAYQIASPAHPGLIRTYNAFVPDAQGALPVKATCFPVGMWIALH